MVGISVVGGIIVAGGIVEGVGIVVAGAIVSEAGLFVVSVNSSMRRAMSSLLVLSLLYPLIVSDLTKLVSYGSSGS